MNDPVANAAKIARDKYPAMGDIPSLTEITENAAREALKPVEEWADKWTMLIPLSALKELIPLICKVRDNPCLPGTHEWKPWKYSDRQKTCKVCGFTEVF